jgi:DNA-binding LacI/PurR family transcriptional regulator
VDGGSVIRVDENILEADGHDGLSPVMEKLMSRRKPPTALFASHDSLALAIRQWLLSHGVSIPAQIALAGYDGIEASSFGAPAITTMEQDFRRMAADAARILMERFDGRPVTLRHQRYIQPHLRIRGSTLPPA